MVVGSDTVWTILWPQSLLWQECVCVFGWFCVSVLDALSCVKHPSPQKNLHVCEQFCSRHFVTLREYHQGLKSPYSCTTWNVQIFILIFSDYEVEHKTKQTWTCLFCLPAECFLQLRILASNGYATFGTVFGEIHLVTTNPQQAVL